MKRILKNQSNTILMLLAAMAVIAQAGRLEGQTMGRNIAGITRDHCEAGQSIGSAGVETSTFKLSSAKEVMMNLSGTMPMHDWTMSAHGLSGEAKMTITTDNPLNGDPGTHFQPAGA